MVWAFLGKVALSAVASPSKAFLGARLEDGDHIYPYDVGKKMSESTHLGMVSRVYTTHKHIVFKVVIHNLIHSDLGDGFFGTISPTLSICSNDKSYTTRISSDSDAAGLPGSCEPEAQR